MEVQKNDITTEFHKYSLLFAVYDELDAFLEKKNACVLDNSPSNRMYMAAAFDLVYTSLKHEMHSGRISESDFWHLKKVLQEETII